MSLKLAYDKERWSNTYRGLSKEFAKYERDIMSGKIPCPFSVEFKINGSIIREPILLNPDGRPKINLY